jgi:hypothetical protein
MSDNEIAKPEDFKRALEHSNVERVSLPASGLAVLLCRPPVFAALEMGRMGTLLQGRVTDAKPEELKTEDVEAFTQWLAETLARLFVRPRFAAAPAADEIGLGDILMDDLKFIFRWLRGEVFDSGARCPVSGVRENLETRHLTPDTSSEDLGRFPGGQGAGSVPGGSGQAELLPSERAAGAHGHAGLSAGLHRR